MFVYPTKVVLLFWYCLSSINCLYLLGLEQNETLGIKIDRGVLVLYPDSISGRLIGSCTISDRFEIER